MTTLQDFSIKSLSGTKDPIAESAGKLVLLVNVASKCGLTPQYEGLEKLYEDLGNQGLLVLGFPCNQFGQQEPGSADEITEFCRTNYSVTFPLTEKIDVNGADQHPVYKWLTAESGDFSGDIEWNFEKFLIGRDGQIARRYPPATAPDDSGLLQDIADRI